MCLYHRFQVTLFARVWTWAKGVAEYHVCSFWFYEAEKGTSWNICSYLWVCIFTQRMRKQRSRENHTLTGMGYTAYQLSALCLLLKKWKEVILKVIIFFLNLISALSCCILAQSYYTFTKCKSNKFEKQLTDVALNFHPAEKCVVSVHNVMWEWCCHSYLEDNITDMKGDVN